MQAKQKFVHQLEISGINYTIIRPTGFFSDMEEFLNMAKKGSAYLFGKNEFKMNPIDGADLAKVCVDAIKKDEKVIDVGGPEVFTYSQVAEVAFKRLNKPARIRHIPIALKTIILFLLRTFTRVQTYGPVEFFMTVLTMDMVAPKYGNNTLEDHFKKIS